VSFGRVLPTVLIHVLFYLFTSDLSGLPPPRSVSEGTEMDFIVVVLVFHPIMDVDFVLWVQNTDTELKTSDVLCLYFSPSPDTSELNVQV